MGICGNENETPPFVGEITAIASQKSALEANWVKINPPAIHKYGTVLQYKAIVIVTHDVKTETFTWKLELPSVLELCSYVPPAC